MYPQWLRIKTTKRKQLPVSLYKLSSIQPLQRSLYTATILWIISGEAYTSINGNSGFHYGTHTHTMGKMKKNPEMVSLSCSNQHDEQSFTSSSRVLSSYFSPLNISILESFTKEPWRNDPQVAMSVSSAQMLLSEHYFLSDALVNG